MKKVLSVFFVACALAGVISAQTAQTSQPGKASSDTKVFALEMGTGFNYDLGTSKTNATQTVSAVFGLTDVVQGGFTVIKGDVVAHDFSMVKIAVFPISELAVLLMFGSDGTGAINSGFGFGYNVFRNTTGPLSSSLQLNAQYLFSDIAKGNLGLGLNLKIGY
jgi:hypothetical protein